MKVQNKIIVLLSLVLCLSFSSKPVSNHAFEINDFDKIIGVYYVDNFHNYLESEFELKLKKPADSYILYSFKFNKNGEIIFTDLTQYYDCGVGILSINKGTWKTIGNNIYELSFDGEYALESKFYTKANYTAIDLKNGNIKMKLNTVLENNKRIE